MLLSGTLYAAPMFHGEEAPCRDGKCRQRGWGVKGSRGAVLPFGVIQMFCTLL
jgi:hypothetical protein